MDTHQHWKQKMDRTRAWQSGRGHHRQKLDQVYYPQVLMWVSDKWTWRWRYRPGHRDTSSLSMLQCSTSHNVSSLCLSLPAYGPHSVHWVVVREPVRTWVCPLLNGYPYWSQREVELALCCSIRSPRKVPETQLFALITLRSLANAHHQNFITWDLHCLSDKCKKQREQITYLWDSSRASPPFPCRINVKLLACSARVLQFGLCFWSHLLFYQSLYLLAIITSYVWRHLVSAPEEISTLLPGPSVWW